MPPSSPRARAYKDVTLQQLRSFAETARLGSLAAAARALGLTHPTVREQVLALEKTFGAKLIEPYGRGCRLTDDGRLVSELVAPVVTSAAALKRRFDQARSQAAVRLVVAGPPRIIQEDLPDCVAAFTDKRSDVQIAFREIRDDEVVATVERGEADLGLTSRYTTDRPPPGVTLEPAYELDMLIVAPKNHSLARRRTVRPADLRGYPLITSRYTFSDQPEPAAILERNGVFDGPRPRVEPFLASTVRRYVEAGFGIALIYGLLKPHARSTLHERSMGRYFGRGLVRFVFRQGGLHEETARALAATIKATNERLLNSRRA